MRSKSRLPLRMGQKYPLLPVTAREPICLPSILPRKKHCIGRWQTSRARTQPDRFPMHWQPYRRCRKRTKRTIWQMSSSIPTALGQNRRKISKVSFRQPSAWWEVPFLTWRIRFCPAPKTAVGTRIRLHQA